MLIVVKGCSFYNYPSWITSKSRAVIFSDDELEDEDAQSFRLILNRIKK